MKISLKPSALPGALAVYPFPSPVVSFPPHHTSQEPTVNQYDKGLARGTKAAQGVDITDFTKSITDAFESTRQLFPTAADIDFAAAIADFDADRLADEPDLARFPELKGHIDLLRGEREGFQEVTGLDEAAVAFKFSWGFYISRRITSQHLARYDLLKPPTMCTNIFFPHGADGVTIADNRDDVPVPAYVDLIPKHRPDHLLTRDAPHWIQGAVSSGVLLDDEPKCIFPANPVDYDLVPDECLNNIDDLVAFMTRYCDFWNSHNGIWVDRQLNAVAFEKTNCLLAIRKPTVNGAVAVTACAYLDDKLHAHQMGRTRHAIGLKGETEATSVDLNYHLGSRKRYRRLVDLTNREAARPGGATLWGALGVVADRSVPFPDRVCLAGEKAFPDREPNANWSLTQHAAVITGPRKRCLYRSVQDLRNPKPVYDFVPNLMLGPGVTMQPAWQADITAGRCTLAPSA